MKILLTGGGTGGHFYPLIAVAREIIKITRERRILEPEIIFASDAPYDKKNLDQENIKFLKIPAGKVRRYFSLLNITDAFKTFFGIILGFIKIYFEMPDVIFSKGGYASMPALIAAKIFKIPLIIHESDSVPGKANIFSKKFAKRIAVSFPETADFFQKEKVAFTGNPIRKGVVGGNFLEAKTIFNLESRKESKFFPPVIFVIGGSQGSRKINDILLEALPELLKNYQIIHQCGEKNLDEVKKISAVVLTDKEFKNRYHLYAFLDEAEIRNAAFSADIIVSRGGAAAIFEIAAWGKPCILIPITNSAQDHQRKNAWNYGAAGAAEVIEETNFSPHILMSEINNVLTDKEKESKMKAAALNFSKTDAAEKIAEEILVLALEHAV